MLKATETKVMKFDDIQHKALIEQNEKLNENILLLKRIFKEYHDEQQLESD